MVISHVHEQVPRAINACNEIGEVAAIGVMEAYSLCAAVVAADAAVKAADIHLMDVRLGRGLGGKSFITMTATLLPCALPFMLPRACPRSRACCRRAL